MVYVDRENKNELLCEHLIYNEQSGYGFATERALVKDFSQADTLYMHGDSIKIFTFNINTDSVYRKIHCFRHVRAYRTDMQAICDSLVFNSQDSCMTMFQDPIVWNEGRQLLGEEIRVFMNDSTVRMAHVIGQALSVEKVDDHDRFNQISSKEMKAFFVDGNIHDAIAQGNVQTIFYPIDDKDTTIILLNYLETDTLKMFFTPERKLDHIWTCKGTATSYPLTQIPADRLKLEQFAWFEELRPVDKNDVFNWRGKGSDSKLKVVERSAPPLQKLGPTEPLVPEATEETPAESPEENPTENPEENPTESP